MKHYKVIICKVNELQKNLNFLIANEYDIDKYERYDDQWTIIGVKGNLTPLKFREIMKNEE